MYFLHLYISFTDSFMASHWVNDWLFPCFWLRVTLEILPNVSFVQQPVDC